MNNYEKLCGKSGELVAFRQEQVLLDAAEIIKRHCEKHKCTECIFVEVEYDTCGVAYEYSCMILERIPAEWGLTTEKTDDFTE